MASCKQIIFGIFNLIFFVLGIAVLGVGIYSKVEDGNWKALIQNDAILQASNILIAAGVFVALIGFFGCFGAFKKNWVCLAIYATLVLLIFILEIAAGIYAYTKRETIQKDVETGVKDAIIKSYSTSNTASKGIVKAVDWFQKEVKCCGSTSWKDWTNSAWGKETGNAKYSVPMSCCKSQVTDCNLRTKVGLTGKDIFTLGCIAEGKKFAKKNVVLLGGVGVGIAVVELLGIICGIVLCLEYKNEAQVA